jgi:hypothetical protein
MAWLPSSCGTIGVRLPEGQDMDWMGASLSRNCRYSLPNGFATDHDGAHVGEEGKSGNGEGSRQKAPQTASLRSQIYASRERTDRFRARGNGVASEKGQKTHNQGREQGCQTGNRDQTYPHVMGLHFAFRREL